MDAATWNDLICQTPSPHILQTWEWGDFKSRYGWQPIYQQWNNSGNGQSAAALVLKRAIARRWGGSPAVLYAPKGPLLDWQNRTLARQVLADLQRLARKQGAIFIKIDPDVPLAQEIPGDSTGHLGDLGSQIIEQLHSSGWKFSQDQIQFRNTMIMDLTLPEAELLARMKQKTRYNIRLASRRGVQVRRGGKDDLPDLYRLYAETSLRDGFVIRSSEYYLDLWRTFIQAGKATPLIAEVSGRIVAGLILFHFAKRAWYLYGMSSDVDREKMPNYLLQWEAIRLARVMNCTVYDLWGAPDQLDEADQMWGVFRFKEGLGAQVVRHLGAWDLPVRPQLYTLYTHILPRILDRMRQRGEQQTRQVVGL